MSSRGLVRVCCLLLLVITSCQAKKEPKRPIWAPQYKVSWNFTVPYVSELQKDGLVYQYEAWQDYENAQQKVIRDGVETVIINVDDDMMYEIFPAMDTLLCWKGSVHGGTGPTKRRRSLSMAGSASYHTGDAALSAPLHQNFDSSSNNAAQENGNNDDVNDDPPQTYLGFVLPDLSEKRWVYDGSVQYLRNSPNNMDTTHHDGRATATTNAKTNIKANVWKWDLTQGDMEMHYTMYTDSEDDYPLELNMMGVNLYTGGHKDNYIAYFHSYEEISGGFPDGTFSPPDDLSCADAEPDAAMRMVESSSKFAGNARSPAQLHRKLMPNVYWGDAAYDVFVHRHGRRHTSALEYRTRRGHYLESTRFIADWISNGGDNQHKVALNHLADWSREEYLSLLSRRPSPASNNDERNNKKPHYQVATLRNFTSSPHFLPGEVIWKGTPADSPVKDQAACGSCWAFSAVASLESAIYRSTGRQHLLSEQQLIDCAWEAPGLNTGCYGGQQDTALEWALAHGGVAPLEDYPYKGVNDFCRRDARTAVPLAGRVVAVEGGEESLMAALMVKGPMAVSVDAESDAFRFYTGGVYSNSECATAAADLNHAVIVSGYGIAEEDGTPYWLVKNMWSPYWGEEGYIRIARSPNDCGIAAQPLYVELDGEDL